jgi:pyruvate/2-oxoglutarate dehydrogenase complex dihydrolipoamide dehydrogenase (E3) component
MTTKKHEATAPEIPERIVIVGGGFAGVTLRNVSNACCRRKRKSSF